MGFSKRKKQPHLYRNPAIDPTPEIAARLAAENRREKQRADKQKQSDRQK